MTFSLISWQFIIAGAITTLAVSIVMAVLGVALGFTVVKPMSDEPTSGLGTAFGVWSAISVLVSLALGGFVAGAFAGVRGAEHGFMVWATVLLLGALFSSSVIGMAVRTVSSAMRGIGAGTASIASTVGQGVSGVSSVTFGHGGLMSNVYDYVHDHLQNTMAFDVDTGEIKEDIAEVLRDTEIEQLQPENIKSHIQAAKSDLRKAINRIRVDSDHYEQIIAEFLNTEKNRLDGITGEIDRDAAIKALMNNRSMAKEEAEKTVDNAVRVYNRTINKAKRAISEAHHQLDEAREHMREMGVRARCRADRMANTAAKSALAAALALVLGAIVCSYAGMYGARKSPWQPIIITERQTYEMPIEGLRDVPRLRP